MAAEITVEDIEPEAAAPEAPAMTPAPEPEEQPEPLELPEPEPPALERQPVAFETTEGEVSFEAAPKKRGRPKGKAKAEGKAQPKKRSKPPAAEPVQEAPPPSIDINALLEPVFNAYMANSEMRKREARRERYSALFQGMVGRQTFM